eukprot:s1724_g1.t1
MFVVSQAWDKAFESVIVLSTQGWNGHYVMSKIILATVVLFAVVPPWFWLTDQKHRKDPNNQSSFVQIAHEVPRSFSLKASEHHGAWLVCQFQFTSCQSCGAACSFAGPLSNREAGPRRRSAEAAGICEGSGRHDGRKEVWGDPLWEFAEKGGLTPSESNGCAPMQRWHGEYNINSVGPAGGGIGMTVDISGDPEKDAQSQYSTIKLPWRYSSGWSLRNGTGTARWPKR